VFYLIGILILFALLVIPTWLALTFALVKKTLNWLPECRAKKFKDELAKPTSHEIDQLAMRVPNRRILPRRKKIE